MCSEGPNERCEVEKEREEDSEKTWKSEGAKCSEETAEEGLQGSLSESERSWQEIEWQRRRGSGDVAPPEGGGGVLYLDCLQCLPSAHCPHSVISDSGICSESRCGQSLGGISANKGAMLMTECPN